MTAVRIIVVRHGNTFAPGEVPRRIGAATDLPLVASGIDQAAALARHLAARYVAVGAVLSSPLRRTRQTADIVAAALGPPVETVDWLREIDHGPDENQPEDEVVGRIGADALRGWDKEGIAPSGWQVDAPVRIGAWRRFFEDVDRDTVLITSNGAARFALLARPEMAVPGATMKLRTGAYGEIERDDAGGLRVVTWDERPT